MKVYVDTNGKVITLNGEPMEHVESGVTPYSGPYDITPGTADQTLQTADKLAEYNIIVRKIPSNYGLVTWDGTQLTIS